MAEPLPPLGLRVPKPQPQPVEPPVPPPPPPQKAGRVLVIQSVSLIRHGTNTPPVVADARYSTPCDSGTTLDYVVEVTEKKQKLLDLPIGKVARVAIIHLGDSKSSPIWVGGFKISPGKAMQGEPGNEILYLEADERGATCRIVLFPE